MQNESIKVEEDRQSLNIMNMRRLKLKSKSRRNDLNYGSVIVIGLKF
jgi:hypothetical protein